MLSALAEEESRIEGLQVGADDYLIKPFSRQELFARVDVQLRRVRAEAKLRSALDEQRALLRELNHRVKNNLEVVDSLLSLQAGFVHDVQARHILAETSNRVRAIADIHRLLYDTPSLTQVDLGLFATKLAHALFPFYGVAEDRVRFELKGERLEIDLHRAVALGMIINELLSNALKHAFPGGLAGTIELKIDARCGVLELADNGIGLPTSLDFNHPPSLGLQLVQTLARQVGGTIRVAVGPGTRYTLQFQLSQADSLSRRSRAS
jgi:two-component sensor histidine kinase